MSDTDTKPFTFTLPPEDTQARSESEYRRGFAAGWKAAGRTGIVIRFAKGLAFLGIAAVCGAYVLDRVIAWEQEAELLEMCNGMDGGARLVCYEKFVIPRRGGP